MKVCVVSYLISRTVTVYNDHYEELRKQKGANFNFSRWVRACIAAEIGEEMDIPKEKEVDELLKGRPRVKLPDGKELIIVDNIEEAQGIELSDDERFVQQVDEYIAQGYPMPPKTMEKYEEAKKRLE